MSEQVQEASMKAYKEGQAHNSRLMSPEQTLIDIFMHLSLQSDPFLAIQYGTLDMKDRRPVKYRETLELLEEENLQPEVARVAEDIIADEREDNNAPLPEPNPLDNITFRDLSRAWGEQGLFE